MNRNGTSQVPMKIMCFYLRSGRGTDFHQVPLHTVDGQNPSPVDIAKTPQIAILKPSNCLAGLSYKSMSLKASKGPSTSNGTHRPGLKYTTPPENFAKVWGFSTENLAVGSSSSNLNTLTYLPVNGRIPRFSIFAKK